MLSFGISKNCGNEGGHGKSLHRNFDSAGTPAKCKIIVGKKTIAYRQKMQPIEQSYNREGKGLRGHNSQRDLDTGGTPAPAVDKPVGVGYNI